MRPLPAELKDIPGAVAVCGLGPEALPAAPGAVEVDVWPGGPSAAAIEPGPVLVCGPAAGGGGDALTGVLAGTLAGAVVVTVAGAAGAPTGHTLPEPGGTWTRKSRPLAQLLPTGEVK